MSAASSDAGSVGLPDVDEQSSDQRLEQLRGRVERCREQVAQLARRWDDVSRHAPAPRGRAAPAKADEVARLRASLDEMENEVTGLRTALQTRGVIEQAKGIIMLREHCDADAAFAMLVRVSQTSHRKLHDVAAALVTSVVSGDDAYT